MEEYFFLHTVNIYVDILLLLYMFGEISHEFKNVTEMYVSDFISFFSFSFGKYYIYIYIFVFFTFLSSSICAVIFVLQMVS